MAESEPVVCAVDFGQVNYAYCIARWDSAEDDFEFLSWGKLSLQADGDATQQQREQAALEVLLTDGNAGKVTTWDLELQVPVRRKPTGEAIIPRIDLHEANIRMHGLSRAVGAGLYAAHRTLPRQPKILFTHAAYKFKALGVHCPSGSAARKQKSVDLVDAYLRSRVAETKGEALRKWRLAQGIFEAHRGRTKKQSKLDDLSDSAFHAIARLIKLKIGKSKSKPRLALKKRMIDRFTCRTSSEALGGPDLSGSEDSE